MKPATKIIEKLRRPPAAHNWVRNIRPRRDDTAFALYNFAINPPRTSLMAILSICAQIVIDGITFDQALKCAEAIRNPASRERAKWIIRAFQPFVEKHGWCGIQVFRDMVEYYQVSGLVRVPVKPTFVLNVDGKLVPYFVICWAQMNLTIYQRRILSTLIEGAILSLEDFAGSDAVIVCTPLAPYSKKERQVMHWKVSDFPSLDDDEKQRLFDRYAGAMDDAEKMLIESLG
jgi:hypothetical protein